MSKNTAWGNKAYKESRAEGGSKAEARAASESASAAYTEHVQNQQFGRASSNFNENLHSANHSKNDGAWHTAEDL
jgi:hypothetical protein